MTETTTLACDNDEQLAETLHRLFVVEGHAEVVIQHPVDGERVVTKDNYEELIGHLAKARDMSPAKRLKETARLKRKQQMKFRTAMITAKVFTVDFDDDDNFGYDVNGVKIDMEGMIFTPSGQYLKGIEVMENEIGAFVSEDQRKDPIRIVRHMPA